MACQISSPGKEDFMVTSDPRQVGEGQQRKCMPSDIGSIFLFIGFLVLVTMMYRAFVKRN